MRSSIIHYDLFSSLSCWMKMIRRVSTSSSVNTEPYHAYFSYFSHRLCFLMSRKCFLASAWMWFPYTFLGSPKPFQKWSINQEPAYSHFPFSFEVLMGWFWVAVVEFKLDQVETCWNLKIEQSHYKVSAASISWYKPSWNGFCVDRAQNVRMEVRLNRWWFLYHHQQTPTATKRTRGPKARYLHDSQASGWSGRMMNPQRWHFDSPGFAYPNFA